MGLRVTPFTAGFEVPVKDFDRRMKAGGSRWQFPESSVPSWLAPEAGSAVWQEFFVASDGAAVHGAYALQRRPAWVAGSETPVGAWYLPISEGSVDPTHALVAPLLMRDALRRAPLSFGLGMDGLESPLSKLVGMLRCERIPVPFFVRIEHGGRVAREARFLRRRRPLARALDVAASTGLAGLGAALVRRVRSRGRREAGVRSESVPGFGPWADRLWERCHRRYSFVARRDAATLERIYPRASRFERLLVRRREEPIGWAVLQASVLSGNRTYGSLHVGRITDCFAAPEDADAVIRAAASALAQRGVDLVLSNQLHPVWCAALGRNAFLSAPSNYVFAPSAPLAERMRAGDPALAGVHLNRGDGDGPWGAIRRGPWAEL